MTTRLIDIFAQVLKVGPEDISPDTSPENLSAWDSLAMVELIAAVESQYGVELSMDELMEFTSVANVTRLLERKGIDHA